VCFAEVLLVFEDSVGDLEINLARSKRVLEIDPVRSKRDLLTLVRTSVLSQYPHMSANGMLGESAGLQYGAGGGGVGGRGGMVEDELHYGMGMGMGGGGY